MDEWTELEQLVTELRDANEDWAKSTEALQQQLESFRELTDQIDRHYAELAVFDALLALNRRVLNDTARLHQARLNFGLTRSAAIIWYTLEDPRPALSAAPPEGQYSLEIRLGPRYLLGVERDEGRSGDQRLSVMISGRKQMVATLPTTPAKLRAALLHAFRDPQYSGPPREQEAATAGAPADQTDETDYEPAAASEQPATPEAPASPTADAGDEPTADGARKPRTERRKRTKKPSGEPAEGSSTEESVIELPGQSAPDSARRGGARRR